MSAPRKPVKVALTASVYLVASSALQGTTTTALADSGQQWKAVQQSIERNVLETNRGTRSIRFAGNGEPTPVPTVSHPEPPTVPHDKKPNRAAKSSNSK